MQRRVPRSRFTRQRGRDALVVEERTFFQAVGVDELELLAALYRLAIPEAVCVADSGRRAGNVDRCRLVPRAKPFGARVIGRCTLRRSLRRAQAPGENDRNE